MDESYSTLDGELQQTGWVKINAGDAAGRCTYTLITDYSKKIMVSQV
jgi:hypothetical protein